MPKPDVAWNGGATDSSGGLLCLAVKFRAATIHDSPSSVVHSELYTETVVWEQEHQFIIKLPP